MKSGLPAPAPGNGRVFKAGYWADSGNLVEVCPSAGAHATVWPEAVAARTPPCSRQCLAFARKRSLQRQGRKSFRNAVARPVPLAARLHYLGKDGCSGRSVSNFRLDQARLQSSCEADRSRFSELWRHHNLRFALLPSSGPLEKKLPQRKAMECKPIPPALGAGGRSGAALHTDCMRSMETLYVCVCLCTYVCMYLCACMWYVCIIRI